MGYFIAMGGHNVEKKSVLEISSFELMRVKTTQAGCATKQAANSNFGAFGAHVRCYLGPHSPSQNQHKIEKLQKIHDFSVKNGISMFLIFDPPKKGATQRPLKVKCGPHPPLMLQSHLPSTTYIAISVLEMPFR